MTILRRDVGHAESWSGINHVYGGVDLNLDAFDLSSSEEIDEDGAWTIYKQSPSEHPSSFFVHLFARLHSSKAGDCSKFDR
eukprot:1530357-Amphidinium_carterae.1